VSILIRLTGPETESSLEFSMPPSIVRISCPAGVLVAMPRLRIFTATCFFLRTCMISSKFVIERALLEFLKNP
jgi:hypothetical protein